MRNEEKTKEQHLKELAQIRQHLSKLEASDVEGKDGADTQDREAKVNEALADLSRMLLSATPADEISHRVLQQAKKLTGSRYGFVGYIDPKTQHLVCPTLTREIWDACRIPDKTTVFKKLRGLWGWVLKNRKPLLTNVPSQDPRSSGTPHSHLPVERFLSAPAMIGDVVFGQVAVANAVQDYREEDALLMQRLADLYALAIQRFRADLDMRQAKEAAEAASMAKTNFLRSMSHELRTPLNAILGNTQVLQAEYFGQLNEKQADYVTGILESGEYLLSLITDILDLSRIETDSVEVKISKVKIAEVLEESLRVITGKCLERGIQLSMNVERGLQGLQVDGDEKMLKQVMLNLLSNAVKFTRDAGSITVAARHLSFVNGHLQTEDGQIIFSPVTNDQELMTHRTFVEISVADTGLGIAPEEQERIFDKFYQGAQGIRGKTPGTGLGLSLARHLVKIHGGKIYAESKGVGKGCTFTILLPTSLRQRSARILVVDDDKCIRDLIAEALTMDATYMVDRASNGTEALIKLGTFHPDVLILDLFMAHMDGVEVCRLIKETSTLSNMNVIIITGYPESPELEEVSKMGFSKIYAKPLNLADLVREVGTILQKQRGQFRAIF